GLRSRRFFEERLAEEWARSRREDVPLGLVLLDMDGFKRVNDQIGHAEGDALLQAVAQALKKASRTNDLLFRWAGDEFAVLLPATATEGACQAGERYAQAIAELSPWKGQIVSAAFGHASSQEGFADPQTLFNAADHRLYNTKRVSAAYPDVTEPHP
ncbi:MAG: GGDEF domain-containing protein, partial [Meiothermus sp.]